MMAHNEVYLRCAQLANASRVLGNLGNDVLSKWVPLWRRAPTTGASWPSGARLPLPAGDKARAQHVVRAEGLGGRGGRRGGVVRRIGELLPQLQVVQDQAVAVVATLRLFVVSL